MDIHSGREFRQCLALSPMSADLVICCCAVTASGASRHGVGRENYTMTFKVGDQVRYNPDLLASGSPEWRGRTGVIISIEGPHSGQGDRRFARIRMDDDDTVQEGISTAMLVPAWAYPPDQLAFGNRSRLDSASEAALTPDDRGLSR
jgi:hypothetical protein